MYQMRVVATASGETRAGKVHHSGCYLLVSLRVFSWLLLLTTSWACLDRCSLSYMKGVARQEASALRWSSVTGCLISLRGGAASVQPNCSKHSPAGIKPRAQTNSSISSSACSIASETRSDDVSVGGGAGGASSRRACGRCTLEERRRADLEALLCVGLLPASTFCTRYVCELHAQAYELKASEMQGRRIKQGRTFRGACRANAWELVP